MSISNQIFAKHCNKKSLETGEFVECDIDLVMVHEQLGGRISPEFRKLGLDHLWDPSKVFYILDHWVPPPDIKAAKMHQIANKFAKDYNIKWNMGQNQGICHQVLPEKGFSRPGMLIVGSDSHTTTYGAFNCIGTGIGATDVSIIFSLGKLWFKIPEVQRIEFEGALGSKSMGKDVVLQMLKDFRTDGAIYEAFEFGGSGLENLSIAARMTIANMTVEMGAKCGVFEADKILENWLKAHPSPENQINTKFNQLISPTKDAQYKKITNYNIEEIPPLVAKPFSPDNVVPVEELGIIEIDEAFLGSCTNGRMEDLRVAAKIVKGKKVPSKVKFIIIPASRDIYLQALDEGLIEIFIKAGGVVEYPSCGPCIGGHLGVLGPEEVCVSSSNRNFKGRMGDPTSKSYLASPAVVAASALKGYITIPEKDIWK
ncbi:MAG: 3-isopropylmalate dehydratase large subunit [Promethearchaeota archaeon]